MGQKMNAEAKRDTFSKLSPFETIKVVPFGKGGR
jgi:hypothetical protein